MRQAIHLHSSPKATFQLMYRPFVPTIKKACARALTHHIDPQNGAWAQHLCLLFYKYALIQSFFALRMLLLFLRGICADFFTLCFQYVNAPNNNILLFFVLCTRISSRRIRLWCFSLCVCVCSFVAWLLFLVLFWLLFLFRSFISYKFINKRTETTNLHINNYKIF